MSFALILKQLMDKNNITKYRLATDLGISRGTIANYLNGTTDPQSTIHSKILDYFNSLEKGETIEASKLPEATIHSPRPKESKIHAVPEDNYMEAAFYDLETSAGLLSANNLNSLPDSKKRLVPREYEKGKYLVVRVSGDSMDDGTKRSVPNGTELLIKEISDPLTERLPIKNYLFVIVAKDGTVLKQVTEQNISTGYLKCHSFNSLFQDYTIPFEDVVQIFKVLKKVNEKIVF